MSDLRNKAAFPVYEYDGVEGGPHNEGMTLREYYAGLAMQGTLACLNGPILTDEQKEVLCKQSVSVADHLLKELETI